MTERGELSLVALRRAEESLASADPEICSPDALAAVDRLVHALAAFQARAAGTGLRPSSSPA